MKRRSLHGPAVVLILLGFGASFVGISSPAPRGATQPVGYPTAIPGASEVPAWAGTRESATGTPAASLRGVPDSRSEERRAASAATIPSIRPRLTQAPAKASPRPTNAPHASQRPQTAQHATARPQTGTTGIVAGLASWFCLPGRSACTRGYPASCYCAAAGPALRAALGDWRGRTVTISTGRVSVRVVLSDWCGCPAGRVVDLYASVWGGLGVPLSAGLVDVEVSW